jgi:hypothetical protein
MLLATGDLGLQPMIGKVQLKPQADPADQVAPGFVKLL